MTSRPFMYIIYQLLKGLVIVCIRIFYPKVTIINRKMLSHPNPYIAVSNHPNTFLDPLHVASRTKQQLFFLTNSGMFKTWFTNWFFNQFYCIPIQRAQDSGGSHISNEDSFARCDEFLGKGGCLYIAPEGTSESERRLRPLKTGTARIGLSAESKKNFSLGLMILPVGLSYSQPEKFGSEIVVNVGNPIKLRDYKETYQKAPFEAARELTDTLEKQMKELIIDTTGKVEDQQVRYLEEIFDHNLPLSGAEKFYRTKQLIKELRQLKSQDPETFADLSQKINEYFDRLHIEKITDREIYDLKQGQNQLFGRFLFLLISFPFFLYGWINNFLAVKTPIWVAKLANIVDLAYAATTKLLFGLISFPLFYYLQYKLIGHFFSESIPILYLISLIPLGLFSRKYFAILNATQRRLRAIQLKSKDNKTFEELSHQRANLWKLLPPL